MTVYNLTGNNFIFNVLIYGIVNAVCILLNNGMQYKSATRLLRLWRIRRAGANEA